jgi:hypothetical protein
MRQQITAVFIFVIVTICFFFSFLGLSEFYDERLFPEYVFGNKGYAFLMVFRCLPLLLQSSVSAAIVSYLLFRDKDMASQAAIWGGCVSLAVDILMNTGFASRSVSEYIFNLGFYVVWSGFLIMIGLALVKQRVKTK